MSNKKLLRELLEQIQKDPTPGALGRWVEDILKRQNEMWTQYKRWATWLALAVSIVYNILKTFGIW